MSVPLLSDRSLVLPSLPCEDNEVALSGLVDVAVPVLLKSAVGWEFLPTAADLERETVVPLLATKLGVEDVSPRARCEEG